MVWDWTALVEIFKVQVLFGNWAEIRRTISHSIIYVYPSLRWCLSEVMAQDGCRYEQTMINVFQDRCQVSTAIRCLEDGPSFVYGDILV